jgi:hypothetical protein
VIDSSNEEFTQPLDGDTQGNVLTMSHLITNGMDNVNQTPNKQDTKRAAEEEEQETPPSPERQDRRETEKMKKLFAVFTANTQKQLIEQAEKHAMKIAAMKQTNKHGNTKPSNNENHASAASKRPQSVSTFHHNDQTIGNPL